MRHRAETPTDVRARVAEAFSRADGLDPLLGSYLVRFRAEAAATAAALDSAAAKAGPLHGVLVGVKDIVATREAVATGQSKVYDKQWWVGRDAIAVARLREAGAVVLGKTSMAEHGLSRPDPALDFPVPRNPWDPHRWTGGSSCGSANGLPVDLFDAAIGTDTNGSVRIPAALCGVTGFKPTHGLVPVEGCRPLSRSLDCIGSLARTVRGATGVLAVMAGRTGQPVAWRRDLRGARVGVPFELLRTAAALSPDCAAAFEGALSSLRAAGAEIVDVALKAVLPLAAAQLATMLAEAFEVYAHDLRRRWPELSRPFRRLVALGGGVTPEIYRRAQAVRRWATQNLRATFEEVTVIATPTWPTTAARYDDAAALQAVSWLPGIWSAVGFPAIAVPMGFGADGLPLSLQLAGKAGDDFALAAVADCYQAGTDFHLRTPRPDPAVTPVAVAEPQAAPAGEGDRSRLAALLSQLGMTVDEAEVAQFAGTSVALFRMFGALPPIPGEASPPASTKSHGGRA
jgi:aspartyl-tRNA(Asn)/glutamyl-tRNA(Gln) amidotransferase subunit A